MTTVPAPPVTPAQLEVRDLGRMPYAEAFALQKDLQRRVIESRNEDAREPLSPFHLLLVEHDPPVITISRRPDARRHLVATEAQLRAAGVEVAETDRGGDITYHGPGQVVAYPIFDLNVLGLRLHGYMRFLEQVVIDTLSQFGIAGERDAAAPGVWVRSGPEAPPSKICAVGVRISRWVTMHGLALNVTTNLDHFNLIIPCGLRGRSVTSVREVMGPKCPSVEGVKHELIGQFTSHARTVPLGPGET